MTTLEPMIMISAVSTCIVSSPCAPVLSPPRVVIIYLLPMNSVLSTMSARDSTNRWLFLCWSMVHEYSTLLFCRMLQRCSAKVLTFRGRPGIKLSQN